VLRLLDKEKVKAQKVVWQLLNAALPVLLVILVGILFQTWRKKQYSV
jgi:hypothetical protein